MLLFRSSCMCKLCRCTHKLNRCPKDVYVKLVSASAPFTHAWPPEKNRLIIIILQCNTEHENVFFHIHDLSYYPKTCNFTICSIFSHSGHVVWCTASSDTILKLKSIVMIQTKFGFNWSSSFREEYFWKSLPRTTTDAKFRQ